MSERKTKGQKIKERKQAKLAEEQKLKDKIKAQQSQVEEKRKAFFSKDIIDDDDFREFREWASKEDKILFDKQYKMTKPIVFGGYEEELVYEFQRI